MNDKPEILTLDKLIGPMGDLKVVYMHGNWGIDKIMMLLPFVEGIDSDEDAINKSCEGVVWGTYEESYAIYSWMKKYGNLPFITTGTSFMDCAQQLEDKIKAYNGDTSKFYDDLKLFDRWRKTVHFIDEDNSELSLAQLSHEGWEYVADTLGI